MLLSEPKEACAGRRLDGLKERRVSEHPYLHHTYKCQSAGVCMCDAVHVCNFKSERMRGLPGDTGHLSHSCFISDTITHRSMYTKCTNTLYKEAGSSFDYMSWAPVSEGRVGCVTPSHIQSPCRQPWDKQLIVSHCNPRWVAAGHPKKTRKDWRKGSRSKAFSEPEKNIHIWCSGHWGGWVSDTQICIHAQGVERATQIGSSVSSDYPPATLTWRDWGHTSDLVALSDVWGQELERCVSRCV